MDHQATIVADLRRPDNSQATLSLAETEPGSFEASILASIPGVYRFHLRATGITTRGVAFTREQLLSGAVVVGGDNPPPRTGPPANGHDKQLCELLECLLKPEAFGKVLAEHNVNPTAVRSCVDAWCKARLAPPSQEELREREGTSTATGQIPAAARPAKGLVKEADSAAKSKKRGAKPPKPSGR